MQTVLAPRGDARTFLTHFVVGGLDDDRYVIEKFRSLANGDIVPVHADGTRPKGRRKARPTIVSLKAVEKMRPARDEIIIATGIERRGSGSSSGAGGPWGFSRIDGRGADRRALGDVPPAGRPPAVSQIPTWSSRWPTATPRRAVREIYAVRRAAGLCGRYGADPASLANQVSMLTGSEHRRQRGEELPLI